jgi:hypothetical protein
MEQIPVVDAGRALEAVIQEKCWWKAWLRSFAVERFSPEAR